LRPRPLRGLVFLLGAVAAGAVAACTAQIGGGVGQRPGGGGGGGGTSAGDRPVIASFSVAPATLPAGGGAVTLSWAASGATQLVIDQGVGPVTGSAGTVQASVTTTTIFTLSASNGAGTVTKSAVVTVGPASNKPVILSFTGSPANLTTAGPSTLTWQVSNATSLSIDNGVGAVSGTSVAVNVAATTVYTLTATNADGVTTAITAVVVGTNPSSRGGRAVALISPTSGEGFVAPASLRLTAWGYDQNVDTNKPAPGLGNNASQVQFFVDDQVVLSVDGANAEFSVFKGFTSGVAAGTHRVYARANYLNPTDVLDSPPALITVTAPPAYGRTVDLTADVVVSGATPYELIGTATSRIRLNGNGHRIITSAGGSATGAFTLKFVDLFDVGQRANTAETAIDVTTSGALTIEDSIFDGSNTVAFSLGGSATASVRRNLFRSNMRQPLGKFPDGQPTGGSYPVATFTGASTGAGVFAGNNVGAGWVEFNNVRGWVVGGDTDADSNVLVGPRVGIHPSGNVQVRRNYSHHVYYGGWSQGNNFDLGGTSGIVVEHNVISGSSWPVRGVGGELRYNLILNAGHEWLWATNDGASVHHNLFIGGEADVGGIYVLYNPMNVRIFNNTIDGLGGIGLAMLVSGGVTSLTSNIFLNVPAPGVSITGGSLTADYNLFFGPQTPYSDGRAPAHDVRGTNPMLTDPAQVYFDLDEVGVWQRSTSVRDILGRYRMRYLPKAGSPAIDAGDPAGGTGNDIGAIGGGEVNADDRFGLL
jgi:hypothetical protein